MYCNTSNSVIIGRQDNNSCSCYRGYYGEYCENHYEWYPTALLIIHSIQTIVECFCIFWLSTILLYNKKKNKIAFNVALISQMTQLVAAIIRIVGLWIPNRASLGSNQNSIITITSIVLTYGYLTLLIVSSIVCVGFWYDIIKKLLNIKITNKTTFLMLAGSFSFLIGSISGMILIISGNIMGTLLVMIPLIGNIVAMGIANFLIYRFELPEKAINKQKRDWVVQTIFIINIFWLLYVGFMIMVPFVPTSSPYAIINDYGFRICEIIITLFLVRLIDFKYRSFYLFISNIDIKTSDTQTKSSEVSVSVMVTSV